MFRRLKDLTISAGIASFAGLSYVYYITYSNALAQKAMLASTKDNTRPNNESFGISWGYRADDIIMTQIDTADLLLLKFDCGQSLSVGQFLKCMKSTAFKLQHEIHGIGVAFRDEDGLRVMANQFNQTKVLEYPELVSQPFLKELSIRKAIGLNPNSIKKLKKEVLSHYEASPVSQQPEDLFNRVYRILDWLNFEASSLDDIQKFDCMRQDFQSRIYVRTTISRTLQQQ